MHKITRFNDSIYRLLIFKKRSLINFLSISRIFQEFFSMHGPRCIQIAFSIAWPLISRNSRVTIILSPTVDRCKNAFTRSGFECGTRATNVQQVIFSPVPGEVTVIGGRRSNTRKIYQRSVHQIRSRFARALSPN